MKIKQVPQLCTDQTCTGCAGCYSICPVNAITMQDSHEGFYRPVIDKDICIGCLKCERTCPVINQLPDRGDGFVPKLYAGWLLNEKIRMESSSGGAFTALATAIISDMGGVVYGAAYDADMVIRHRRVNVLENLASLRLSKYAQSFIGETFRQVKADLESGRHVLFCGTPCQGAGLRSYLKKEYDKLIICDFVCHGVPSPLMLKSYKSWLEKNGIPDIIDINFRDKRKGWYDAVRVVADEHKTYVLKGTKDNYWIGFNDNKNLQECCYDCKFLGMERKTDLTIADFWGIGKKSAFGHKDEIKKGVSAIIVSTSKGDKLFEKAQNLMALFPRDMDEIMCGNAAIIRPSFRPSERDSFYQDLKGLPYDSMIKKYLRPNFKTRIVKLFREFIPASITTRIRQRGQK